MSTTIVVERPTIEDPSGLLAELVSVVVTPENYPEICDCLLEAKSRVNHLEASEKKITDPITAGLKEARAWFAGPKKTWQAIERLLKDKVSGYQSTLLARKAEAIRQVVETAGAPDARGTLAELVAAPHTPAIQHREVWDFEVTDPTAVPREYLQINEKALRALAGKDVDVAGVRFFKRPVIAVRVP